MVRDNPLIGRGWAFPVGVDGAGGIALASGTDEIDESIALILGTSLGERVMRPNFGCRIHELVFSPLTGETLGLAKKYVEEALGWWEPRITVVEVRPQADERDGQMGKMLIWITYEVRTTHDRRSLVSPFYLIREE